MKNLRNTLAVAAVTLTTVFALSACSSSGADSQSGTTGKTGSTAASSPEEYEIKFTQCLRDKGIDIPDPDPNKSIQVLGEGLDPAAFSAATEKCTQELGPAPSATQGANVDQEILEEGVKAAQCLRDQGYDVPDPKPGEGLTFSGAPVDAITKCLAENQQSK